MVGDAASDPEKQQTTHQYSCPDIKATGRGRVILFPLMERMYLIVYVKIDVSGGPAMWENVVAVETAISAKTRQGVGLGSRVTVEKINSV